MEFDTYKDDPERPWIKLIPGSLEYPEEGKKVELLNEMILNDCQYVKDNKLTKFIRSENSNMSGKVIAWRYAKEGDCGECKE